MSDVQKWAKYHASDDTGEIEIRSVGGARLIARVVYPGEPRMRINTDLIAAAPELLAALKGAEMEIVEYLETLPKPHDCENTLANVRAAIAKAEGRL